MAEALLNPHADLTVAKAMLGDVEAHIDNLKRTLTTSVLDREVYLGKIHSLKSLEAVLADLQQRYSRSTAQL